MLVISNYNIILPEYLFELELDWIIYDQSNKKDILERNLSIRNSVKAIHTGHNLSDYFRFIIDNYEELPEVIRFVKGNIVPRHCNKEYFLHVIKNKFYTGLYNDPLLKCYKSGIIFSQIHPGIYLERNSNNIYARTKPYRYFHTYNGLLSFLFADPIYPSFIAFSPGGCFIVERSRLLNYPKKLYEVLYYLASYSFFTLEAYHIERLIHTLLNGNYKLRTSPEQLLLELESATSYIDSPLKTSLTERVLIYFSRTLKI